MGALINLKGMRFGRLVVDSISHKDGDGRIHWNVSCDCGNTKTINGKSLRRGLTKSCGCLNKEVVKSIMTKHGLSDTQIYQVWLAMKNRCYNEKVEGYDRYGGRGIKVCGRWLGGSGFQNFMSDMGERPDGMTIERIDNDKDYSPDNCRWATMKEQCRNKRSNRWLEHNGEKRLISEWASHIGIGLSTLVGRLERGWSIKRALETPTNKNKRGEYNAE